METVISVKHLEKSFSVREKDPGIRGSLKSLFSPRIRKVRAVRDLSFSITSGEMVGFIGPNGAGKTTTLKMLSGILYPTSGSIDVLGYPPFERRHEFLKRISLVMGQKNQLIWDLPAMDTFNLNRETYGIPDREFNRTLDLLVELFEIGDILTVQVRRLSLGQRMKCELVASLLHTPKILFLDEPTIGLDIVIQKKLRKYIKEFNAAFGTTVILTSHYMDDVKEIASRIMIVNDGSLVYDDTLSSLSKRYADWKGISLTLNSEADPSYIRSLGESARYDYPKLDIRVSPRDVASVTAKALSVLDVDDIDIAEPELADIVAKIFERK